MHNKRGAEGDIEFKFERLAVAGSSNFLVRRYISDVGHLKGQIREADSASGTGILVADYEKKSFFIIGAKSNFDVGIAAIDVRANFRIQRAGGEEIGELRSSLGVVASQASKFVS